MREVSIKRNIYGIVGSFTMLAVPFFITLSSGVEGIEDKQSLCPFKMVTGMPCPGCGVTKSIMFLYEGDLWTSLYYHVFGPLVVAAAILAIIVLSLEIYTKKTYLNRVLYNNNLTYVLAASLTVYHLTRLIIFISENNFESILQQSIWA
jgi:hypothetical protein